MDVTGVLGLLEQSIRLAQHIKRRFEADKENGPRLTELEKRFTVLKSRCIALRQHCEEKFRFLNDTQRELFREQFSTMNSACGEALQTLEGMANERNESRRVKLFSKSLSHKESLDNVEANVDQAEESLKQLNNVLSTWNVVQKVTKEQTVTLCQEIRQRHENTEARILQRMELFPTQTGSRGEPQPGDTFKLSFIVPPYPCHVKLDYDTSTTFEGRLKAEILNAGSGQLILKATGAVGMGGTGKTCAMKGLAEDSDIQERFPQGVYFISLGMDADSTKLVSQLRRIVRDSGGLQTAKNMENFDSSDIDYAVRTAREWFKGKDCLFLIDDMWEEKDLNVHTLTQLSKLAKCSKNSYAVFTTRNEEIASRGQSVQFKGLDPHCEKSWGILLHCAGFTETEITSHSHDAISRLLAICSGLPLALAIVGCAVRILSKAHEPTREGAWIEYLNTYENPGQDIVRRDLDGYKSLSKTVRASVKILEINCEDDFSFNVPLSIPEMFRSLCILEKQESMDMEVLSRLWRLNSSNQALRVARCFEQLSLIKVVKSRDNKFYLQLHDLIHDIVCIDVADNESEPYWHNHFLDGFIEHDDESEQRGCRSWWECWRDFPVSESDSEPSQSGVERHLEKAGLHDELLKLEQVPRWKYADHVRVLGGQSLIGHFERTLHFVLAPEDQETVLKRALMVIGTERSERAMKFVQNMVSFARQLAEQYDWPDDRYHSDMTSELMIKGSSLWFGEWEKELVKMGKAFRSGTDPYCRTGTEVIDSS